jgi:NADH:ubiquinone oxidoreductase subunit
MMDTNIVRVGRLMGRGESLVPCSVRRPDPLVLFPSPADEMGNTYYEALPGHGPAERKRWVEPSHYYFDASEVRIVCWSLFFFFFLVVSQVSPQWHRWLHYQTDEVPSAAELDYVYRTPHRPNLTGTQRAYRPSGYLFQTHAKVRAKCLVESATQSFFFLFL